MKKCSWLLVAMLVLQSIICTQAVAQQTAAIPNVEEEMAASIGTQVYIYGLPLMLEYQFRNRMKAVVNNSKLPDGQNGIGNAADGLQYNEWLHVKRLAMHENKTGVSPNEDTNYSVLFADVSKEPLMLTVPPIKERYYNIQISDAYLENIHYIGTSTGALNGGVYALVGPNYAGTLPKKVKILKMPHNFFIPILRIQVRDRKEDLKKAIVLQETFTAQSLSAYLGKGEKKMDLAVPNVPKTPLAWFSALLDMMKENPPIARDALMLTQMKMIGLTLDGSTDVNKLSEATKKGLERAFLTGKQAVEKSIQEGDNETKSHWLYNYDFGNPGQNYLVRATYAQWGLTTHSKEEAIYFRANFDENRQILDGKNKYTITISSNKISPCRFFWSITSYVNRDLTPNKDHHYSASNDRESPAKPNADGSITLYIQAEQPKGIDIGNWIPTPTEGAFQLIYRMYGAKSFIFDSKTLDGYLPPIRKIE